ncbi:MAG TPA: glycosyltransferase [Burkholderiaceae bacterium]|nr:glycosyltransferase [Burkholderiaceae bacterium]
MKSKGWGGGSFGLALAFAVALTNLLVWQFANRPVDAPEYSGTVTGLAYNAFQRWDAPNTGRYPTNEQINSDLLMLSKLTRRIRTYSSSEFIDLPAIAAQHGMRVTAGVWLDGRFDNNRREIEAVKIAVRHNANIERVIAGNEVLLHGMLTLDQMTAYLRELRRTLRVPVSTAEPWHIWLRYPELARNVDYIVVHLLPFWEGVPAELGVDYALKRFEQMRQAFPDKHIVIGEIGWPSQGERFVAPSGGVAASGPDLQAKFIREFLARSNGKHLDYFLMEAIDQPWKTTSLEGRVGAHWGIFYADRTPKFEFTGPLERDPNWQVKAVASSLLGLLAIAWFARRFSRLRVASRVTYALFVQASASAVVWLLMIPADYYLRPGDWLALAVLLPTLTMMIAIVMAHGFEFAEMFWRGNLQREFGPRPLPDGARQPMVSVHLACCNEQPEVVIATIDSLRRLDYENFEVLVVDNNTRDEALWRPVEAYMSQLGPRFKFFHLPSWPGFKAGALNFALTQTDPAAEVVGVVDADYVVRRDWLRSLVAYFDDPQVAVVQAPQAHRSWARQAFRRMMNWEYDGFFRIGMHHRNERDAIIQHGTMTLIRADALNAHGRWSEWCICEDAELGLRLMKAGYSTVYVDRVMGEGLTPDDFGAFKKQRRRWAFGAMQILKHHSAALLRPGQLSVAQRYHFVSGWLSWFGDALHLIFAMAAVAWTIGIVAAPKLFHYPIMLFLLPLIGFFGVKALFGPLLYWRRVPCSVGEATGAAVAGMALSHAIAMGVYSGLWHRTGVFEITKKGASINQGGGWSAVREEALLLTALLLALIAIGVTRRPGQLEATLWMVVLGLQAIPYAAAVLCTGLSKLPEATALEPAERPVQVPAAPVASQVTVAAAARPVGAAVASGK